MENKKTKMEFRESTVLEISNIETDEEMVVITRDTIKEDKKQILDHYHNNTNPFEIT